MLAKFKNGNFLEVNIAEDDLTKEYDFCVYDKDGNELNSGWTSYRDMSLYPNKNEIDYIVDCCEPKEISGKYELLDFDYIDDYFDSLTAEDPDGKWILERQGSEDDIRRYSTFEVAQCVMNEEYEETYEDHVPCMHEELDGTYASIGDEEFYQAWSIYEDKEFDNPIEKKFHEIQIELNRIYTGVEQYVFELQDTGVITNHVDTLKEMIEELKEMI